MIQSIDLEEKLLHELSELLCSLFAVGGIFNAFSTSFIQMPFNGTLFFLILKLATFFYTNNFQTQSKSS